MQKAEITYDDFVKVEMRVGRIVEVGETTRIFAAPAHPYTRALLAAAPKLTPGALKETPVLPGDPPSPVNVPSGCAFRTRCAFAVEACAATRPELEVTGAGPSQAVACLRWRDLPPVPRGDER